MKKYAVAVHYLDINEILCAIVEDSREEYAMIKAVSDDVDFIVENVMQCYGSLTQKNIKQYYLENEDTMISYPRNIAK